MVESNLLNQQGLKKEICILNWKEKLIKNIVVCCKFQLSCLDCKFFSWSSYCGLLRLHLWLFFFFFFETSAVTNCYFTSKEVEVKQLESNKRELPLFYCGRNNFKGFMSTFGAASEKSQSVWPVLFQTRLRKSIIDQRTGQPEGTAAHLWAVPGAERFHHLQPDQCSVPTARQDWSHEELLQLAHPAQWRQERGQFTCLVGGGEWVEGQVL